MSSKLLFLNDDFLLEKLPWLLCPGRDIWWVEKRKGQRKYIPKEWLVRCRETESYIHNPMIIDSFNCVKTTCTGTSSP